METWVWARCISPKSVTKYTDYQVKGTGIDEGYAPNSGLSGNGVMQLCESLPVQNFQWQFLQLLRNCSQNEFLVNAWAQFRAIDVGKALLKSKQQQGETLDRAYKKHDIIILLIKMFSQCSIRCILTSCFIPPNLDVRQKHSTLVPLCADNENVYATTTKSSQ